MVQDMVGAGHNMDMNINAVPGLTGSAITRTNTATLNTGKETSVLFHFKPFESAVVSIAESAKIGEGTIIQPNVFIGNHVEIGKNCVIHPNVTIYDGCKLGDRKV